MKCALVVLLAAVAACDSDGSDGKNGSSCSVSNNSDGSVTISCTDGTRATIGNGQNGTTAPLHAWVCPTKSNLIVDSTSVSGCTIAANASGVVIWDLGGSYFLSCSSYSTASCSSLYDSIGDSGASWVSKQGATTLFCVPQGGALAPLSYTYTIASNTVAYINFNTSVTLATAQCTQSY
jgi:hypothetical protein